MPGLRPAVVPLGGLDWRGPIDKVRGALLQVFETLLAQRPRTPADLAALYAMLNVLHRMGTLAHLNAMTLKLFVNEYGLQPHFDPYDARGYCGNVFIDFGSTRGPDLVYPRTVDLWSNHKRSASLRFLPQSERLAPWLKSTDAPAFWALCEAQAHLSMSTLDGLETVVLVH